VRLQPNRRVRTRSRVADCRRRPRSAPSASLLLPSVQDERAHIAEYAPLRCSSRPQPGRTCRSGFRPGRAVNAYAGAFALDSARLPTSWERNRGSTAAARTPANLKLGSKRRSSRCGGRPRFGLGVFAAGFTPASRTVEAARKGARPIGRERAKQESEIGLRTLGGPKGAHDASADRRELVQLARRLRCKSPRADRPSRGAALVDAGRHQGTADEASWHLEGMGRAGHAQPQCVPKLYPRASVEESRLHMA
jgi:hypothetical protein